LDTFFDLFDLSKEGMEVTIILPILVASMIVIIVSSLMFVNAVSLGCASHMACIFFA
jgi:hypothetical protein